MQKEHGRKEKDSGAETPKAKSAKARGKRSQDNAAGPTQKGDNVVHFTAPNWENYLTIPALAGYLERIASERGLEIEQRNFKRFALYRPVGRYKRDYVVITIAADGTVGPIAGAAEKALAAEHDGAQLFLVPKDNADEARRWVHDLQVVPVERFDDAVRFLCGLEPRTATLTSPVQPPPCG